MIENNFDKNSKSILFDLTFIKDTKLTGVERYSINLYKELSKHFNLYVLADKKNISIIQKFLQLDNDKFILVKNKTYKLYQILSIFFGYRLEFLIKKNFYGYIFPNFRTFKSKGINFTVIHDLTFKKNRGLNQIERLKLKIQSDFSFKNSNIICVSKSVKHEIENEFNLDNEIVIFYPNFEYLLSEKTSKIRNRKKEIVFLSVGTICSRKNYEFTIKNFMDLECKDILLIICGSKGDSYDKIVKLIEEDKRIKILTNVSDNELYDLYRCSDFLISSSIYEGFGMQVVEGNYFNIQCILSDIEAHKEVSSNTTLFFDTKLEGSLARLLNEEIKNYKNIKITDNKKSFDNTESIERIKKILNVE